MIKTAYVFYLNAETTKNFWKNEKGLCISYVGTEGLKCFTAIYFKSLLNICIY